MSEITPGALAVYGVDHDHAQLVRVLRTYTKPVTRRDASTNKVVADYIPFAEVIVLVDLQNLQVGKVYHGGLYIQEIRCDDLAPWEKKRQEVYDDIASRLQRLQQQIRVYETTTECDPPFQTATWRWDATAKKIKADLPPGATPNKAELINIAYGACYPNAHLKFKT